MTLLPSRCVLNTEKLVHKWRNDVFLCSTETAVIVKAIMLGWIRPKKIERWWYLEWRGTGPLSLQDKGMWQAGDEGYKGEELQRRHSSTCGFDCLSSLQSGSWDTKMSGWKAGAVLSAVSRTRRSNALTYGDLNPLCSWMGALRPRAESISLNVHCLKLV